MKVAILTNFPPASGIGRYAYSLYNYLNSQDFQADLILLNPFEGFKQVGNGKIITINKTINKLNFFKNYLLNPYRIPKGYDVYHITAEWGGIFAKHCKPSIVTFHDVFLEGPGGEWAKRLPSAPKLFSRRLEETKLYHYFANRSKKASKFANLIICNSAYTAKNISSILNLSVDKVRVLYYGFDLDVYRPGDKNIARKKTNLPMNKKLILTVGSEKSPRKNITRTIIAFAKVKETVKDAVLIRAGDATPSIEILRLIDNLGLNLGRDIIYVGEVTDEEEMSYYYQASDVLAYVSLYEGFGRPVIEAMASGCSVVTSNCTALPETVGDAGILVDPFNITQIASALETILTDEKLKGELINKGLKRAKSFSLEKQGQQILKIYEEVLNNI